MIPRFFKIWPTLYKRSNATGKVQMWTIAVRETSWRSAWIVTQYGQVDGKVIETKDHIEKGKNIGKVNETNAVAQAVLEARALWKKKRDRNGYTKDESGITAGSGRAPMLAQRYDKHKGKIDWTKPAYVQPKLDGHRCIASKENGKVILRSRGGKLIKHMEHIKAACDLMLEEGDVIDGELCSPIHTFQEITSAIKRRQDASLSIEYYVYDVIINADFEWRSTWLRDMVAFIPFGPVKFVETEPVRSVGQVAEYFYKCLNRGNEGAMVRHGFETYEAGKRSYSLLKVKRMIDKEFTVTGCKEGRGSHKGMAIFQCVTRSGDVFDVTAPGTHTQKKRYWRYHKKYIGKRLTVQFFEYTTGKKWVPRFPVALRFRKDV